MNKNRYIENFRELSPQISDIAFSTVAAGLGTLLGGVQGSALGATIGTALKYLANDLIKRLISENETNRIEVVSDFAIAKIKYKYTKGEEVKNELFKNNVPDNAIELFEGVILKAKSSYESKKLYYISNLFANAPFEDTSFDDLNLILKFLDDLTYEQLLFIHYIYNYNKGYNHTKRLNIKSENEITRSIYINLNILQLKGLIIDNENVGDIALTGNGEINLTALSLSQFGWLLYRLTDLQDILKEDIERFNLKVTPFV